MSGGSYEYLCDADADDLLGRLDQLESMAARLSGLGYAEDAAREAEELLLIARQYRVRAEVRLRRLYAVMHAVEWWDSRDYSEDQVREALATYRSD